MLNGKCVSCFLFILLSFHYGNSAPTWRLDCAALQPEACKNEFRQKYSQAYRLETLHLIQLSCDEILNSIENAKDTFTVQEQESVAKVIPIINDIKSRATKAQENDDKDELQTEMSIWQHLKDIEGIPFQKISTPALNKNVDELKFAINVRILEAFAELYNGLKETDLQAYPKLKEIKKSVNEYKTLTKDDYDIKFEEINNQILKFFDIKKHDLLN